MKNFKIISVPENLEDKIKPSIHVYDGKKLMVILWCDGQMSFMLEIDYLNEDVAYFCKIGSMFYTFFNNIKT